VSLPKTILTDYRGTLGDTTMRKMDKALKIALAIED
jgi:hypothetical protein